MDDEYPIRKLEAAVSAYLNEIEEDGSIPSGWVLSYNTTRLQSDPDYLPMQDSTGYVIAPNSTGSMALGILTLSNRMLLDELLGGDGD